VAVRSKKPERLITDSRELARLTRRAERVVRWRERLLGAAACLLRPDERSDATEAWKTGSLILQYHQIIRDGEPLSDPFAVRLNAFRDQIRWLNERYHLVTTEELSRRMAEGTVSPLVLALSLDDGYDGTYHNAWPVLHSAGVRATLFVDTGRLDGPTPALSSSQLRTLAAEGMEIGSHSVSHADMTALDGGRIRDELLRSRDRLEALTGQPVTGFAYPFGRHNERVVAAVRETGYQYACTCLQHRTNHVGDNPWLLKRLEINGRDDLIRFGRKLAGRYANVYAAWYRLNRRYRTQCDSLKRRR
jgi:peptidoglycan/xylan/chitin deacetylase (PgdA/CDA1 family)